MKTKFCVFCLFLLSVTCSIQDGDDPTGVYPITDGTDVISVGRNATDSDSHRVENVTDFSDRPGFVGRITQKGFNFAASLAIRMFMKKLSQLKIPNMKSTFGITVVTLSDVQVKKFPAPGSRLYPIPWPGYGMRWHAYNINPVITAKYKADMKFPFWKITKEGTATFTGQDMYFILDILISRDVMGHPTIEVLSCLSDGDLKLSFKGEWSDMLNIGATMFAKNIRSVITAQMCYQAKTEINTQVAEKVRKIPLQHILATHFILDLSMLEPPTFQDDAIDVPFKGVVYVKDKPEKPPFPPPEIGNHDNDDHRMIYLYVTDYLINSAFYSTFSRGVIAYNITPEMVPEDFRSYLNTTCSSNICLGTIFPQLSWLHPSSVVSVSLSATTAPFMSIDGNTFNVTASGLADVFIQHSNSMRESLFIIKVDISGGFVAEIVDSRLYFNVSHIDITCPHAEVKYSFIGDIGTGFLFESVLRLMTQTVLIPRLSEKGAEGLNLPKVKGIQILQPEIIDHGMKNVFVVATDIGVEVRKRRFLAKRRYRLKRIHRTRGL